MKPTDSELKDILTRYKRITVVGLSSNSDRPSYRVTNYLKRQHYEITGVNPAGKRILDLPVFSNLNEVPGPLEIVDVFRAPEHIPALVDELIPLKPKVLWLQEGITNAEAESKARNAGIFVVSDQCMLKTHRDLIRKVG